MIFTRYVIIGERARLVREYCLQSAQRWLELKPLGLALRTFANLIFTWALQRNVLAHNDGIILHKCALGGQRDKERNMTSSINPCQIKDA